MNKTIVAAALTVVVVAGAIAVYAPSDKPQAPGVNQQQAKQRQNQNRNDAAQRSAKLFEKMDVNNDGSISREEFLAQAELRYGTLDKNKDGRVGLGEIRKKDIDADKDRSVTKQEFLAHAGKRFRQKDANNDGKLDLNEFKNRKAQ